MAPDPTGDQLQRIYTRRFPKEARAAKAAMWKVLVEEFLQRWLGSGDTVLDLGCGFGDFINAVRCRRRIGVDLNEEAAESLNPDVEFHAASISDLSFIEDGSIDVVFTSNVLEHLPDKAAVEETMQSVHDALRPGGTFIALGPNVRLVPGAYWDFWDHHVPISDRSLVELLEVIGFDVVDCIPRFLPYTTVSRLPQSPGLVRLYLRFRPAWWLLGKQFVVRARKGDGTPR